MKSHAIFHTLRIIASFSLVGVVLFGAAFGWVESINMREIGAVAGAGVAILAKVKNII